MLDGRSRSGHLSSRPVKAAPAQLRPSSAPAVAAEAKERGLKEAGRKKSHSDGDEPSPDRTKLELQQELKTDASIAEKGGHRLDEMANEYEIDTSLAIKGREHLEKELAELLSFVLLTNSPVASNSLATAAHQDPRDLKESANSKIIVFNRHGLPAVMNLQHAQLAKFKKKLAEEKINFDLDSFALVTSFSKKTFPGLPYTKECKTANIADSRGIKKIPLHNAKVIIPICYESDLQLDASEKAEKLSQYITMIGSFAKHTCTLPGSSIENSPLQMYFFFSRFFDVNDPLIHTTDLKKAEQEKIGQWSELFGDVIRKHILDGGYGTIHDIYRDDWVKKPEYQQALRLSQKLKTDDHEYKIRYDDLLNVGYQTYFMRKQQAKLKKVSGPPSPTTSSTSKIRLLLSKPRVNEDIDEVTHLQHTTVEYTFGGGAGVNPVHVKISVPYRSGEAHTDQLSSVIASSLNAISTVNTTRAATEEKVISAAVAATKTKLITAGSPPPTAIKTQSPPRQGPQRNSSASISKPRPKFRTGGRVDAATAPTLRFFNSKARGVVARAGAGVAAKSSGTSRTLGKAAADGE